MHIKTNLALAQYFPGGCVSLAPEYARPPAPVPQQFSLSRNSLTPVVAGYHDSGWRSFFTDPQVAALIAEALNNNRDLKMAALKVEEARAQFNVTDADRYPQLNASSGVTYSGGLKTDKPTTQQYDAGLNLSYELDFFGKLRNMSDADRQNYFASEEARRAVHILLVSSVSQSYFSQQLAYKQRRIARDTLKNYQQSWAFVEQQLVTGSTNVLALEQARGQIESTRAEIAKEKASWLRPIMPCSRFWEPIARCRQRKEAASMRFLPSNCRLVCRQKYCFSARTLWKRSIN